jgi:uncharacterized protein
MSVEWIILGVFSALAIASLFLPWGNNIKQGILVLLTITAVVLIGGSLFTSLDEPQFSNRLELFETDLLLQASQAKGDPQLEPLRTAIAQSNPQKSALENYQEARDTVQKEINSNRSRLDQEPQSARQVLKKELLNQSKLRDELDLRLGLLKIEQKKPTDAIANWKTIEATPNLTETAEVLMALWSDPPKILPRAELLLTQSLNGWFRFRGLERLYQLQQRSTDLAQLQSKEQAIARQALIKQVSANGLSTVALLAGIGILLFLVIQGVIKRKQSLLAGTNSVRWMVPWSGEAIWQVLIVGFFAVGQLVLQFLVLTAQTQFKINLSGLNEQGKAFYSLGTYTVLAAGALGVLFWSIRSYLPLPAGWFRFSLRGNWFLWGFGGWLVAFPLVIAVSFLNQQIWQGRGGSNPLLPIAIESRDPLALLVFFGTAAIAAPLFEETFFRGFLLPSLTKYLSTWQAILVSSLLFAAVHLSLSELLPLMTLGCVLGFVYTRSQNLMSAVLLHALWNGGTMLTLFIIGGAAA